jgi:hypothetical protein
MSTLLPIDSANYRPSRLHDEDRVWGQTNCYVDLWIELLNALGFDSTPALAFTLSVDFDGDQWRSFKFPLEDLRRLYGLDVAEMSAWRELAHHVDEQLGMGRFLIVEVDSYYLPDTERMSYQVEHVKTVIAPNMIDREHQRLGYFHNTGYYELQGDDFADIFERARDRPEILPPYVELVRLDRIQHLDEDELFDAALGLVRAHLQRRPTTNPVQRFRRRLDQDIEWLRSDGLATFHLYAYATLRQFGSSAELAGSLCEWLAERGEPITEVAVEFRELASDAKTAQFQLARVASGRTVDVGPVLGRIEHRWAATMHGLADRYA